MEFGAPVNINVTHTGLALLTNTLRDWHASKSPGARKPRAAETAVAAAAAPGNFSPYVIRNFTGAALVYQVSAWVREGARVRKYRR